MKRIIILAFAILICQQVHSQTVNQVSILPANPTTNDTVFLVTDFSYSGACSYEMVYNYTSVMNDTILTMPTYCGYGMTTPCTSVDTFALGIFNAGTYTIHVEFHQGSVCPISGFDATLTSYFTNLTVNDVTGINNPDNKKGSPVSIFPNPASKIITVLLPSTQSAIYSIKNTGGQTITKGKFNAAENQLNIESLQLKSGMYILETELTEGTFINTLIVK